MSDERIAPGLQSSAKKFLESLRWTVEQGDSHTLQATMRVAGNELRWALHFVDESSFSSLGPPDIFVRKLLEKSATDHFFDVIVTDKIFVSRRWTDEIGALLERRFSALRNRRCGTWVNFLNRFAIEISAALMPVIEPRLQTHFIKRPVRPHFADDVDALQSCLEWLVKSDARLMTVKGEPGAGKSVFSLLLAKEIESQFSKEPNQYPAPFLVWFSTERPAVLEDLITLTLLDLGLTHLTADSVKFLLSQGRIILILDGFDEISRALAHRARDTIDKLGAEINKRTKGRLILTSRPAFLVHEKIFSDLTAACEEDQPTQRDIAGYSDSQQREWVIQNPPEHLPDDRSPDQHWQRVQTAFAQNPDLRELCRTPVYLRMLSQILVKETSVRSRYHLIQRFCEEMWERERGKRKLSLSDEQYLLAYEAISVAIVEGTRIDFKELREYLKLYFDEYAPEVFAALPGDDESLLNDLAIGPLTREAGRLDFAHEVLTGYFFARRLARTLASKRNLLRDLWNKRIYEPAWRFLKEAVQEAFHGRLDTNKILGELSQQHRDGLMLWNIAQATGGPLPQGIFRGKDIANVVFEDVKLDGMQFDGSNMHDVTFIRCKLSSVSFKNARIGHMSFVECQPGAVFDDDPLVTDDAEIILIRGAGQPEETYVGQDIGRALAVLSGAKRTRVPLPANMAEEAALVIFQSLFKADCQRLDYPEPAKIEKRLRGWLMSFQLEKDEIQQYLRDFLEMLRDFESKGWICRNPNRQRTLVPCESRKRTVAELVRLNAIPVHETQLRNIVLKYQGRT